MTDVMPPESDAHANGREPDLNTLAAFVDCRLDPSARDRVVLHLAECARCRAIVAELMNANADRRTQRRRLTARALPIAATFLIAAAGGGLYFALRDHAPAAPHSVVVPAATPSAATAPSASTSSQPSTAENTNAQSPATKPPVSPPTRRPQSDRTRAVGTKSVGRKTFRLVAGEWIDTGYRRTDLLPVVDIQSRPDFAAHPDLHRFATLGPRFIVVVGGVVYRVKLPPSAK
jgi:hypothetical protein